MTLNGRLLMFLVGPGLLVAAGCAETAMPSTVAPTAEQVRPLAQGRTVPNVTVRDLQGQAVSLQDLTAGQPTVLFFYRGGWCPYCNRQLADMQMAEQPLKDMGYQLLALSPDRPEMLRASLDKQHLTYTLLSDSDMAAAKAFGVAFQLPESLVSLYHDKYKIDLEGDSGRDHHQLPVPSVFITDTEGTIRWAHSNPDYKVRPTAKEVIQQAQAALNN